jgi:protein-tyrosine phosphatase
VSGALPDVPNFRDAGGLSTGSLRPGLVYRSAQLSPLTDADHARLLALDVRAVFDLRTADEVRHRPDTLPPGLEATVLDVLADRPHSGAAAVASLVTAKQDQTTVEDVNDAVSDGRARDLMIETYRHLVSLPSAHVAYRTLLASLAKGTGASVIHCTAGKDRTGWAIALLQGMGGASTDDVMADYLLSNVDMETTYRPMLDAFAHAGGDAESLADMILVRPEYLEAALTLVRRVHADLDGYLTQALGLDPSDLSRLRARLLT